jgi:hypothetical protein
MAVLGMEPAEVDKEEQKGRIDTAEWTWTPQVKDADRLADALRASSNTTRNTYKDQLDHGENK